jgi:diaminopimelate epimerase
VRFAKAHGLGNDFMLVEAAACPSEAGAWARRLCDRNVGVGADGILVHRVEGPEAVRMRLINADGSDAEISGNGVRCLAAYAAAKGWVPARHTVLTVPGPRAVVVETIGENRFRVATDLGPPGLGSEDVPIALDPPRSPVVSVPVAVAGTTVRVTATSMGNPHCAVFVDAAPDDALLATLGPALEHHPLFPRRTNVEFVLPVSRHELRAWFWERGVGRTRASGTGAASAAVAAILEGRTDRSVRVQCEGGVLEVEWPEAGTVRQRGEVELLFEGEWLLSL